MTEQEKLMLGIMGRISNTDAPLVFKGALITKLILSEHGFETVARATTDMDANWTGSPPSMDYLVNVINQSLGDIQYTYSAQAVREYKTGRSAGVSIVNKNTDKAIFTMDISMKPVQGSKLYFFGDIGIRGVLPDEVLADKIAVISSRLLFRRMKDLVDVYALSHCVSVRTRAIAEICSAKGREIEGFDAFLNRMPDVEHAYNRLKDIEGKPAFDSIYSYMREFVKPFSMNERLNAIWDSDSVSWRYDGPVHGLDEPPVASNERPSLQERLRQNKAKAKSQDSQARDADKRKSKNAPDK